MRQLLRVKESFRQGDRVLLTPFLGITSMDVLVDPSAELRGPDGVSRRVHLQVCPTHFSRTLDAPPGSKSYEYVCVLTEVSHEDVAPGSELWASDDVAAVVLDRPPLL